MITEYKFQNMQTLSTKLSLSIQHDLLKATTAQGYASLIVSGGSTPKPLFEALSALDLSWPQLTISLADDRWLEATDDHSNENLVRTHLIKKHPVHFIALKNDASSAQQGVEKSCNDIDKMNQPFDVLILGMGDDAHTASIFPLNQQTDFALNPPHGESCVAITPHDAPYDRISMTLPTLLNSKRVIILLQGESKWRVFEQAKNEMNYHQSPISAILNSKHGQLEVWWADSK